MLAMRDEEVFAMFLVFATGLAITWLALHYNHRQNRLKTIQKALDAGNIDETTRRTLIEAISADAQQSAALWRNITQNVGRWARIAVFVVGWLLFTVGGAVLAIMLTFDSANRYEVQSAMVATAIGFGLVTLPLALREMGARTVRS
ncbi:MAG: hypothetical protein AB7O97_03080 [Planctomycetota bacterium]